MAARQPEDLELQSLRMFSSALPRFEIHPLPTASPSIICDVSTGTPHPLDTKDFRQVVFDTLYGHHHPGIPEPLQVFSARYVGA